jgi:hypothetical protein
VFLETRYFINQVFIFCHDGKSLIEIMSTKSQNQLKSLFGLPQYYDDATLGELKLDKMILLHIWSIVNGYDNFLHKLREEILAMDNIEVHRAFNELLLDNELRNVLKGKIWIKDPRLTDHDYFHDSKCENMIEWFPKFNPI